MVVNAPRMVVRRHSRGVSWVPPGMAIAGFVAAQAQATSPLLGAWQTANRWNPGGLGRPAKVTAAQVAPESVERNRPSAHPASTSTAPPEGCTEMLQHRVPRREVQVEPPSAEV